MAFGAVLFPTVAFGESGLPPCPSGDIVSWTNCEGTATYSHGGKYVGEFRDGKPNGQGNLTYRYDGEYVGEFRDGWPNAQGAYTYPDGRRYVGEWRTGDFDGRGVRTYPDGRKETGEWSGGKLIGSPEENLLLPIQVALLVVGAALAAVFGLKSIMRNAKTPLIAVRAWTDEADEQSRVAETQRALLEAVEDFSVSDAEVLELRRYARQAFEALKSLKRKAARKRLLDFTRFW